MLALAGEARAGTATLAGYDVLGRPGRAVKLSAKLETEGVLGVNPDVVGEPLDFYLVEQGGVALAEPRFLGSGDTSSDGVAEVEWTPGGAGQFTIEARVRRGSQYIALPAPMRVAVPPPERPIVLVQLDGTVHQASNLTMFRGTANEEIPAVDGAAAALRVLSQQYQLVYLTGLDSSFTNKFRDWLQLRQVPVAPVLFWDLFSRSLSHETYMRGMVEHLRQEFPQATIGIGSRVEDGTVYVELGLAAIVLGTGLTLPDEVVPARRWEQAIGHVVAVHRTGALLRDLASRDAARSDAALAQLVLLGKVGLAYVHRFRAATDLDLAAAATLVTARLRASEAFYATLSLTTPNQALAGLLAAWRSGDRAVVARLFREPARGLDQPIPVFRACETVSRNEPEPGRIVFRIRLIHDQGPPAERDVVYLRQEDGTWRIDVGTF